MRDGEDRWLGAPVVLFLSLSTRNFLSHLYAFLNNLTIGFSKMTDSVF